MGSEQTERREIWRQRIAEQERSGLTVRAYCQQHELPEPAFYGWRRRLRPQAPVGFALVQTKPEVETRPVIKETAMLELVLTQGDRLRIPGDEAMLRLVLGVLREQA
jgi:hypothetical protein